MAVTMYQAVTVHNMSRDLVGGVAIHVKRLKMHEKHWQLQTDHSHRIGAHGIRIYGCRTAMARLLATI